MNNTKHGLYINIITAVTQNHVITLIGTRVGFVLNEFTSTLLLYTLVDKGLMKNTNIKLFFFPIADVCNRVRARCLNQTLKTAPYGDSSGHWLLGSQCVLAWNADIYSVTYAHLHDCAIHIY